MLGTGVPRGLGQVAGLQGVGDLGGSNDFWTLRFLVTLCGGSAEVDGVRWEVGNTYISSVPAGTWAGMTDQWQPMSWARLR